MATLLIGILGMLLPAAICAAVGRVDGQRQRWKLWRRVLSLAAMLTVATSLVLLIGFAMLTSRQTNGPVTIGISWVAVIVLHLWVLVGTTAIGAVSYAVGYRSVKPLSVEGSYGGEAPVSRLDESGNPYQPPST